MPIELWVQSIKGLFQCPLQSQGYVTAPVLAAYLTKAKADTLYQPLGDYAAASHTHSQYALASALSDYALASSLTAHASDTTVHISATERTKWNKTSTDLAAILGSDSDTIINKWEEVVAFLDTYTEADTLAGLLGNKVDKVAGMGLSHNDFTDTLKSKLDGIEAGANRYVHPMHTAYTVAAATGRVVSSVVVDALGHVTSVGSKALTAADIPELAISKITGLQDALDSKAKKQDFDDFVAKFDSMFRLVNNGTDAAPKYAIEALYGVYTYEFLTAKGRGGTPSQGGTFDPSILDDYAKKEWIQQQGYVTAPVLSSYLTKSKADTLYQPLGSYALASHSHSEYALASTLSSHTRDTTAHVSTTERAAWNNKVDKVAGKGLSENDFTDALLSKLNGIAAGANNYVLPKATADVLGGVRIGANISLDAATGKISTHAPYSHPSHTIRNIAAAAGLVLASVSVNALGHVTDIASKQLAAADIPQLAITKVTGLQGALDGKAAKADLETLRSLLYGMFTPYSDNTALTWAQVIAGASYDSLKASGGIFTESFMTAKVKGTLSSGSGSGSFDPSVLDGYAQKTWVQGQGYITAPTLQSYLAKYMPYVPLNGGLSAVSSVTTWGVGTGTTVAEWTDAGGSCAVKFKKDCPAANKLSLLIDGTVYVNEGQDAVATQAWANGRFSLLGHTHSQYLTAHQSLDYINVKDVRGAVRPPSYFGDFKLSSWFNNTGMPASDWYAGIHVRGWTGNYASWELAATSTTNVNDKNLYFRVGINSTWEAWQKVLTNTNYSSILGGVYAPLSHSHSQYALASALSNYYSYKLLRSDINSVFDARWNYGAYDKGDYNGAHASEYPTNYGTYLSLTSRDKNMGVLILIDTPTTNALGHVYVKTRGAGDGNVSFCPNWGMLAYTTDTVANANALGGVAASNYVTRGGEQTITGRKVFAAAPLFNYFATSQNHAAFVINKLGTNYFGMGGNGTNNVMQMAHCGDSGDWLLDDTSLVLKVIGAVQANSIAKIGGTASQVLMADGSVKALTDITSAYVTALGTSGNYLTWTKNGAVNNITVPYATEALRFKSTILNNGDDLDTFRTSGLYHTTQTSVCASLLNGPSGRTNGELWFMVRNVGTSEYGSQFLFTRGGTTFEYWVRTFNTSGVFGTWQKVLTDSNYTSALDTRYVKKSGDTMTGLLTISVASNGVMNLNTSSTSEVGLRFRMSNVDKGWAGYHPTYGTNLYNYKCGKYLAINDSGVPNLSGSTIWHAGNDGSGSGLDADMLDGAHGSEYFRRRGELVSNVNALQQYEFGVYMNATGNGSGNTNFPELYGVMPVFSTGISNYVLRLHGGALTHQLKYQIEHGDTKTEWMTLARITDNVASATNADKLDGYHNGEVTAKTLAVANPTTVGVTVATAKANLLAAVKGSVFGNVAKAGQDLIGYWGNDSHTTVPSSMYSVINVTPQYEGSTYGQYLLFHYGAYNPVIIGRNNGAWTSVKTLAFLSDNVASATKLADNAAYTAWGQTYFQNGKPKSISGDMTGVGNITSNGTIYAGAFEGQCLELSYTTPYIDFHFNRSTADYTSRIIETASGQLSINNTIFASLSGNVGIGTSTPSEKCHINGWVGTIGATGWKNTTYGGGWYMTDGTYIRNYNSKRLALTGSGNNDLLYLTNGAITINAYGGGAWNTGAGRINLPIVNDSSQSSLMVAYRNGTTDWIGDSLNRLFAVELLNSGAQMRFCFEGETKFTFYSNGEFYATAGMYTPGFITAKKKGNSSDERLKKNIKERRLSIETILNAPCIGFDWRDGSGRGVGTTAQYWLRHLPEVVLTDPDGYYAVDYGVLAHMEVSSLAKYLAPKIEDNEAKIRRLERRVAILERELKAKS